MRLASAARRVRCSLSRGHPRDMLSGPCTQVARVTWRLLTRHVSACARCGLLGCWPCCQHCMDAAYCSVKCQG